MIGALSWIATVSTFVFTVSSMLSVGMTFTVRELFAPLRNLRIVLIILAINFVLIPLYAMVVVRVFSPPPAHGLGLFLIAAGAGAPFVIKLVSAAEGHLAKTASMLVLLVVATVIYLPLVIPWVLTHPALTHIAHAPVDTMAIARPLLLGVLLPLAVGLWIRARHRAFARRTQPIMGKLASIAIVVLIAATVLANLRGILSLFVTTTAPAIAVLIAGAFAIGYVFGGRSRERRIVLGLGSAQRNIAAAMVVATQSIGDAGTITVVVSASVIGLALLFALAALLRRHQDARPRRPSLKQWGEQWGAPVTE